jgi:hypothetical protein
MTKEQLKNLVDRTYASWNQTIATAAAKTIYNAWWTALHDITTEDAEKTLNNLIIHDRYMPRPGTIRKNTLTRLNQWNPPSKGEAWTQFRQMAEQAHTGTTSGNDKTHPLIKQTAQKLGGSSSYNLHTNGDRELFFTVYEKLVYENESVMFEIPAEPAQ